MTLWEAINFVACTLVGAGVLILRVAAYEMAEREGGFYPFAYRSSQIIEGVVAAYMIFLAVISGDPAWLLPAALWFGAFMMTVPEDSRSPIE